MVLSIKKTLLFILLLVFTTAFSFGTDIPKLKGRVNDYADIITSQDKTNLTQYLEKLEKQTGIQLVVLTVPTINGDTIENYSIDVATEWKLGQKGEDNGILFTVALQEHDVRIEVGYGLEAVLTDAKSSSILRGVVIPEFKKDNYSKGILNGVTNIVGVITEDEELIDPAVIEEEKMDSFTTFLSYALVFIIILINFLIEFFKFKRLGPEGYRRYRTSRSSSGGSSSSFSGGGGSFGGGGASGSW